jgi:hypothetical protein
MPELLPVLQGPRRAGCGAGSRRFFRIVILHLVQKMKLFGIVILFFSAFAFAADLPDPKLTPGATLNVSKAAVCTRAYAGGVRNVPASEKNKVYAEYGIKTHVAGEYEVDHLISLELGGSNEIANLWPQSYSGVWNAHVKDALEDRLHALVCAGTVTLADAQHSIRTNWIAEYQKIFKTQTPLQK